MKRYRYGCLLRPPAPGAVPSFGLCSVQYNDEPNENSAARWGWVEYDRPLTAKEIEQYELVHLVTFDNEQGE